MEEEAIGCDGFLQRVRCLEYRQNPSIVRVTRPTLPDKARRLGYKAKQLCEYWGAIVSPRIKALLNLSSRETRGQLPRRELEGRWEALGSSILTGLMSHHNCHRIFRSNWGWLQSKDSSKLKLDSTYKYFEVILVDASHNAVCNDPRINWICKGVHKHRELRELTSAGKQYRSSRGKGHLYHKNRPSHRATWKRNQTKSLRRCP